MYESSSQKLVFKKRGILGLEWLTANSKLHSLEGDGMTLIGSYIFSGQDMNGSANDNNETAVLVVL